MKIYTNANYEIIAIDVAPTEFEHEFETQQTRTEMFSGWCDTCIQGFKYEPQYEMLFNEDGSNQIDKETGELLYKLDENGGKIPMGYAYYPFMNYQTLILFQKQYEESQKQVQSLNAQVSYLQMVSGVETEENNE